MSNIITVDFPYDDTTELNVVELSNADIDLQAIDIPATTLLTLDDLKDMDDNIAPVHNTANTKGRTWDVHVVTIGSWPEVKTKTCHKWVKIPLDGKVKVPYPCVWRRTCKKSWFLRIVYSGDLSLPKDIERTIKDCAKTALIPALPILLTGNVGGAVAAFLSAFKTCLIAKGVEQATSFSAGFHTKKVCGSWKRI